MDNDIFNLNEFDESYFLKDPELTKDDFIKKTKELLTKIDKIYGNCWEQQEIDEDSEEYPSCTRCGGFTQIEQGGESVDCNYCRGTGIEPLEMFFNYENFSEEIKDNIIEGDTNFYELLGCKIKE